MRKEISDSELLNSCTEGCPSGAMQCLGSLEMAEMYVFIDYCLHFCNQ